ncbi:MAG TPA: biliverdin-producing heme oxygenase [Phycisphaerales bacterium]|nr:biliverdin-producing heme oxygenase [Phycisphaerales bacterium]HMP36861.1 biliverdin-producing heme oxygenase [Phycisphaerales bacterium]
MPQQPSLMDRLKAETRKAHDETEAIPFSAAMVAERLPVERFVGQLAAYRIVHAALESALAAATQPEVRSVWRNDLAKGPLLERDLAAFARRGIAFDDAGIGPASEFAESIGRAAERDPLRLLGALYVLEGSTLGAAVLRGHLASAYGLTADEGLAYQSPYGASPMPHWREFKARMNDAVVEPTAQERVIAGAIEAFERIGRILASLSDGLSGGAANGVTAGAARDAET